MKKELRIKTMLGLLVAVGGLLSGIWLIQGQLNQATMAAAEEAPQEVKLSNISESSFTVTWDTNKVTTGYIQYGESGKDLDLVVADDRDLSKGTIGNYSTHMVTVKGLRPETAYSFRLGSGKNLYDLKGLPYKISTGPKLNDVPPADVAYGQAYTQSDGPANGAVVLLQLPGSSLLSAMVKPTGSWVIPISSARTADLKGYAKYDQSTSRIEITVDGGLNGVSKVVLTANNDAPVPTDIVLGNDYNFLGATSSETATDSGASKFAVAPTPMIVDMQLISPRNGEQVNSARPEIIGEAPPGTKVTVEVHSETPISGSVQVDDSGKFSFSTPDDLEPGEHTVTITGLISGVKKTITRSFTVYAAGESNMPAFSATPSATLAVTVTPTKKVTPTPTVKPSPTLKPTATVKPSPTVKPATTTSVSPTVKPTATIKPTKTPTPTVKVTAATDSGIVKSGSTDATWLMLLAGMAMVTVGVWNYRKVM